MCNHLKFNCKLIFTTFNPTDILLFGQDSGVEFNEEIRFNIIGLTGSAGPQNSLKDCGVLVPCISKAMQGPEHSSVTILFRERVGM